MQFTSYEQTFQILLKDTFPPINNRIILLLSLNYLYYYSNFYKFCNNSKYLEHQLHNHGIVQGFTQKFSKIITHYPNIDDPPNATWGTLFVQQWLWQFSPQINLGLSPSFSHSQSPPLSQFESSSLKGSMHVCFFHYESSFFQSYYPCFSKSLCFSYCVTKRTQHHCDDIHPKI